MMRHNRVGRLLRHEHEILAENHADLRGVQKLNDLGAVFQVRTSRITKAIAAATITLMEYIIESSASSLPKPNSCLMRLCQSSANASADSTPNSWRNR